MTVRDLLRSALLGQAVSVADLDRRVGEVTPDLAVAFAAIREDLVENGEINGARVLAKGNGSGLTVAFADLLMTGLDESAPDVSAVYTSADLPTATGAAWKAIVRANAPERFFRRGDIPVRIVTAEDGRPVIENLTVDRLRHEVARAAEWKTRKRSQKGEGREAQASPPRDVILDMLASPPEKIPLPVLSRLTRVPAFAPDGTLVDRPGYDAASRIYYAPEPGLVIPPVPKEPTGEDVRRAAETLVEPFVDFPLKGDSDLAHVFSLVLIPFVREMVAGYTPLHLIEAPCPGSGKGLLRDVALTPGVGKATPITLGDEAETRKKITSALIRGTGSFDIDNARRIDSGNLSAALTMDPWTDRILGVNRDVSVPNRCAWTATANNPVLTTELARRCVRIRIESNVERPWTREGFRYPNLLEWARGRRGELIAASLTIVSAWIADGKPSWPGRPLGSFEPWSRVLGGILDRAGVGGFLDNLPDLWDAADIEGAAWRELIARWWEAFKTTEIGIADLFPFAEKIDGIDLGRGQERSQRTAFGMRLRCMRDRIISGYQIMAAGKENRAAKWRLIPTERVNLGEPK